MNVLAAKNVCSDRRPLLWGTLVLGVSSLMAWGCRSTSKEDLGAQLAALSKNEGLSPIQRRTVPEGSGSGATSELIYFHGSPKLVPEGSLPVVLVHGTPSTLYTWVDIILGGPEFDGLGSLRDVYAVEVTGHGIAPSPDEEFTFQMGADRVVACIEGLGLEAVHLVGSSYGGEFVWRAALDRPDLIASITLMDSSGYERRPQDWLPEEVEMRENSLAKIGWMLNSPERVSTALLPHFATTPKDQVEEFYLVCSNASNWYAMVDLVRDENGSRQAEIPGLQMPALLIWGARDIAYSPSFYATKFAEDISGAELVLIEQSGHYPYLEQPAETLEAMKLFFDRVDTTHSSRELHGR
jgi:pimeloyl-ACP methyl ester carboxylesterase